MTKIVLIAAMARNRTIGRNNQLIWHIPSDLKHFKKLTTGHVIVMGRKTFQSIGRPLPNRTNAVLTRSPHFRPDGVCIFHSLSEALESFKDRDLIYIAGGADIYRQALPLAHQMEITLIDRDYEGDATFPEWDENQWEVVHTTTSTDKDGEINVNVTFMTLVRKNQ
ncbi:MAG: dihydrofolate reductase [Thermaurantimonas sp.]